MILNKSTIITFAAGTAAGAFGILAYNKVARRRSPVELECVVCQSEQPMVSLKGFKNRRTPRCFPDSNML